jgi:hypothetical protein
MTVQAKFRCIQVTTQREGDGSKTDAKVAAIKLQAVYEENGPNKSWAKYTPMGELTMQVTNPAAIDAFEVGQCYLLEFTPVE